MIHPLRFVSYLFCASMALAAAGCGADTIQGCASDADCRFDRICASNTCTEILEESGEEEPDTAVDPGPFADFVFETLGAPVAGTATWDNGYSGFRLVVFMSRDGTFVAYYDEGFFGHGFNPFGPNYDRSAESTRIAGAWRAEDGMLFFEDLLECTREERLLCRVMRAVANPDSEGLEVSLFENGASSSYPMTVDDPDWSDHRPEE